jgi:hypothetical protein
VPCDRLGCGLYKELYRVVLSDELEELVVVRMQLVKVELGTLFNYHVGIPTGNPVFPKVLFQLASTARKMNGMGFRILCHSQSLHPEG